MSLPCYSIDNFFFLYPSSCDFLLDRKKKSPKLNSNFIDFFLRAIQLKESAIGIVDHTTLSLLLNYSQQGRDYTTLYNRVQSQIKPPLFIPLLRNDHWVLIMVTRSGDQVMCSFFDSVYQSEEGLSNLKQFIEPDPQKAR